MSSNPARLFQELKARLQDIDLLLAQLLSGQFSVLQPTIECLMLAGHDTSSMTERRISAWLHAGPPGTLSTIDGATRQSSHLRPKKPFGASVLALNNRQATIRVGTDIPIATSQEGIQSDSSKISFDFKYLALGILLNIRPRVSDDGNEVSTMVDTIVSDTVPEADLQIRDEDGQLLASAPRVTTRRVQTYARVKNNTPFIIGGLVGRDETDIYEKVPLLGDLPLVGALFRSERHQSLRQEVIIVLTPYVLPERIHMSRALPRHSDLFDADAKELLRSSYRVREEDIADVSFLYRNERFLKYRKLAGSAIRQHFELGQREPFFSFADGRLPGEKVIVDRILYNTLSRVKADKAIGDDRVFVLTARNTGGYDAAYIESFLAGHGGDDRLENFFTKHPNKALAISFHDPIQASSRESLIGDPVPDMRLVDCPDREQWGKLLWVLNQPAQDIRRRYTILIHRPEDLARLRQALMIKFTLHLNGGGGPEASLLKFLPGRVIEIPDVKPDQRHLVDAQVARHFFHSTQHFYATTINQIEAVLTDLDAELRAPEIRALIDADGPGRR